MASPAQPSGKETNTTGAPTIFITGATDGLGRSLARRLAADGADLICTAAIPGKREHTADEIQTAHGGNRPRTGRAHLAELAQVHRMAREIRQRPPREGYSPALCCVSTKSNKMDEIEAATVWSGLALGGSVWSRRTRRARGVPFHAQNGISRNRKLQFPMIDPSSDNLARCKRIGALAGMP